MPENKIIAQARDEFLASLPPDQRDKLSECESTDDMIAEIRALEIIKQRKAVGKTCINVVQQLGDRLKPFFQVVDTFVSSNPNVAALVWGSLRFVFLVSSKFRLEFKETFSSLHVTTKLF